MTADFKRSWTEADVIALIGQCESIRREFKAGVMFEREPESKWIEALSKEVSALANTEGGELILGIDEDKRSKPRLATEVDGVPTSVAPERLQQLIEGNLSPYLPGMRVHRVGLSHRPGRVAFVIQIPQGSTAYQAKDGRYYGRSEFEAKYLPDHEVRLRMMRGRVARAAIRLRLESVALGIDLEAKRVVESEHAKSEVRTRYAAAIQALKADPESAVRDHTPELLDAVAGLENLNAEIAEARDCPDEIAFDLVLRNEGELTIRDPVIEIREQRSEPLLDGWTVQGNALPQRLEMHHQVIYPGEEREIPNSGCHLRRKRQGAVAIGNYRIAWRVFLDNSPPSAGEIDLGAEMEMARHERSVGRVDPDATSSNPQD